MHEILQHNQSVLKKCLILRNSKLSNIIPGFLDVGSDTHSLDSFILYLPRCDRSFQGQPCMSPHDRETCIVCLC